MTEVLFIAVDRPRVSALDSVAGELRRHYAAIIRVMTYFDPEDLGVVQNIDEMHRVQLHLSGIDGKPVRRFSPQWFWVLIRNPILRRKLRSADLILRPWLLAQNDPWVRHRAGDADVLVALDTKAVYTVWELAQTNTDAKAVRGLYEALEALKRRGEHVADMAELSKHGHE